MTPRAPMIAGDSDSAETFRLALSGIWVPTSALNARTGLTSIPALTGTGNLTATVGACTAVIDGTSNSLQGCYPVALDGPATITIGAGNTQPRIDLICLQVQDNSYDGSGETRMLPVVVPGTPAGSPVAPSTPTNAIPLWTIPVAANATSVTWGSATAVYPLTAAAGGIVPVRNATDQPPVANGVQYRHRLDVTATAGAASPLESSTDGVTWTPVYSPQGAWTTYTPALAQGSIGNGSIVGAYYKIGRLVTVRASFTLGSTSTITGNVGFTLPFTTAGISSAGVGIPWAGTAYGYVGSGNARVGMSFAQANASSMYAQSDNVSGLWTATVPGTWVAGGGATFELTYESAT